MSFGRGDCCSTEVNDHARNVCRKLRGQQLQLSLLLSYRLSAVNVRARSRVGLHIDHVPNAEFEDNCYKVHFSFSCLVALYIRIMQTSEEMARDSNLMALFEVMKCIVNRLKTDGRSAGWLLEHVHLITLRNFLLYIQKTKNFTFKIRGLLANGRDNNYQLITWIKTNNIIWRNTFVYGQQDGWKVGHLLRNNVLINEHCVICPHHGTCCRAW